MSRADRQARLQRLQEMFQSGEILSSRDLAGKLNVSRRTVFRDIRTLQKRGVNVVWVEAHQAYLLEDGTSRAAPFRRMETVRIWFHPDAAAAVSKLAWISADKTHSEKDGSLVVEMRVSRFDDIVRWVLSFGDRAKILEPVEIRDQLVDRVDSVRRVYDDES